MDRLCLPEDFSVRTPCQIQNLCLQADLAHTGSLLRRAIAARPPTTGGFPTARSLRPPHAGRSFSTRISAPIHSPSHPGSRPASTPVALAWRPVASARRPAHLQKAEGWHLSGAAQRTRLAVVGAIGRCSLAVVWERGLLKGGLPFMPSISLPGSV